MTKKEPSKLEKMMAQSPHHKAIGRFLSVLSEQHGKGLFWIYGQMPLYYTRFNSIPMDYFKKALHDYLLKDMPHYCPTLPQVAEYVYGRNDFQQWYAQPTRGYCKDCRTDRDGNEGGMRFIFYYGFVKSLGKIAEREFAVNCSCEAGRKNNRAPMDLVLDDLRNADPDAQVFVDYYCEHRQGKVTGKQQAPITMEKRLKAGVLKLNEHGDAVPNFSHPLWYGATGYYMAIAYNVELPPDVKQSQTYSITDTVNRLNQRKIRKKIARENTNVRVPKSIGQMLTPVESYHVPPDIDPNNCPF